MAWSGTGNVRAVVVMTAVTMLVVLSLAFQRRADLPARSPLVPPAGDCFDDARDATFRTSDGLELAGWYVQPARANREVTVLVAERELGRSRGTSTAGPLFSERYEMASPHDG